MSDMNDRLSYDRPSHDRRPGQTQEPIPSQGPSSSVATAAIPLQPDESAKVETGTRHRAGHRASRTRVGDAPTGALAGDVTQARVMQSEWTKLRSLRSTLWTMGLAALLLVILAVPLCISASGHWNVAEVRDGGQDPVYQSLGGLLLAQVAVGVLGVLTMTGEYATGMIRATFGLVPRRLPVLWAKGAVLAAATFLVMLVASLVAFFIGQAILAPHDLNATLGTDGAARAVLGCAFYLTGVALLGLLLGALIRHTAGAVSALLGALLGLPLIFSMFEQRLESAQRYLPALLGNSLASTSPTRLTDLLTPGRAFLVMCGYLVALGVAAAFALVRRDV